MPRAGRTSSQDSIRSSDSSDSEDDFLRLAPVSVRKKAGLMKPTSPRRQHGTQMEKSTNALQNAHRKATFIVAGQKATQKRLEATKAALNAQSNSIALDSEASKQRRSIFETNTEETAEIPELSFQFAPSNVQDSYQEGYLHVRQQRWKEATEVWEKIVSSYSEINSKSLEWQLPLYAQLAFAYKKQGLLRLAISNYNRICSAIYKTRQEEGNIAKDRSDFVADALYQMSMIYHELGDMEHAIDCTERANAILLQFMGSSSDSPEETARVKSLHRDRQLSRMLKDVACGDFGTIDDTLAKIENLEESDVTIEHLAHFVDPTTGATFLMAAAGCGHMPLLTKLCTEALGWQSQLEVQDGCGNSALAWACKFGQVLVIQYLLDAGASFQSLNKAELKSWPKTSLQTIQEHIQQRKKEKAALSDIAMDSPPLPHSLPEAQPPLPSTKEKKSQLYKPLVPVEPVKKNTGFNAAPPSIAAASGALVGRELQAWTPDDDATTVGNGLESETTDGNWDQFEANKRLFGVRSEFNEEIYTTKLNKDNISAERVDAADALAREILSERSTFKHVNEERGIEEHEDIHDPEAKYGAVLGSGAYADDSNDNKNHPKDSFLDSGVIAKNKRK